MLLEGKRIIVTGGVTGIGLATTLACAREGASVVTFSTAAPDRNRVKKAADMVERMGAGRTTHIQVDISDKDAVDRAFAEAADWMGGLDGLANSAATQTLKPAIEFTKEDIEKDMAVTTFGTVYTNQAAFRLMKDHGGSIVNVTSYVAIGGQALMGGYGIAKGGVNGWSHVVAREWGPHGIRVNMVAPVVESTGFRAYYEQLTPEAQKLSDLKRADNIALGGKMAQTEDAGNACLFLLSDLAKHMTGQLLYVDGGITFSR
jgi:NAD(P)-dependent dehydrogenase (short-subunit alcohol dehydrogenase family)